MEREFIAHHIKEDHLRLVQLTASIEPRKYLEDYSKHSIKHSKDSGSTRSLQFSTTKTSGAYQSRGSGTAHRRRML
jgi:hypothetical protein